MSQITSKVDKYHSSFLLKKVFIEKAYSEEFLWSLT